MPYSTSNAASWASAAAPADTARFVRASNLRIARTSGDRMRAACTEARRLEPGVFIDYIPMGARWRCMWVSNSVTNILHDPARGDLLWVGINAPPLDRCALRDSPLYVCRQCITNSVYEVVIYSQLRWQHRNGIIWTSEGWWYIDSEVANEWIDAARTEWHTLAPVAYGRCLRKVDRGEAWRLVTSKSMTKEEFLEWLDQRAWDNGQEDVGKDVETWSEESVWWPVGALKEDLCVRVDTLTTVEVDKGWAQIEAFLEGDGPEPAL